MILQTYPSKSVTLKSANLQVEIYQKILSPVADLWVSLSKNFDQSENKILKTLYGVKTNSLFFQIGCNFHKCRIGSGFVGCLSFRNCNLDEADLSECQLGNRTFNGSTMKFANIRGTNLESASFADVVAVGIKIDDKTNLERAVLTDADFSEVNFSGISLFGCKFDHAFLIDSDLSNCRTNNETTFVECTLANTKMNNSKFLLKKPAKVIACQFQEANLQYSEFERIVKWDGVTFEKSNLSNCTFIECGDLTNVNFKETTMDGARFTHSNLSNHQFISQSLARVEFLSVNLSNTRFDHCNLIRAVFTDTNMNSSHFIECAMDFITLDKNTKTFMERIKFISCKMANLDLRGLFFFQFLTQVFGAHFLLLQVVYCLVLSLLVVVWPLATYLVPICVNPI